MRLIRLLKSESIQVAALYAALFVLAIAAFTGTVLWIVADHQRTALAQANAQDVASIFNGYRDEGIGEAEEVLRQMLGDSRRAAANGLYMTIQRPAAARLGNLPLMPERVGEYAWVLAGTPTAPAVTILGRGEKLSDSYVFVGRDTRALTETRASILQAFFGLLAAAVAVAAAGAYLLARRLTRRVDLISQTCEAIIAGQLTERVPVQGQGAEWQRLARAINEMLSRIALLLENLQQVSSDIAHDLRTPLARMRHRLESARDKGSGSVEHAAAIGQAIEDTDALLGLFASLLRIAQIEAGTRISAFKSLDLGSLLQSVAEIYQPVAEDAGHTLTYLRPNKPSVVSGDTELLLQMFCNLVENAIRHTASGTAIQLELAPGSPQHVAVSVRDNGAGIPEAEFPKVTRRFYRLSGSRSSPGHGLGLALVSAIASLHGAALRLRSAGPGLVATVELELVSEEPAPASHPAGSSR